MIHTEARPVEEILQRLPPGASVGILGCGDCAAVLGTGGTLQVDEWTERLQGRNKVLFATVVDSPCDQRVLKRFQDLIPGFADANFILVLACSAGAQSLANMLQHAKKVQRVIPCLRSKGLNWIRSRKTISEACFFCEECRYEGEVSCPVAACPLHRADGPCQNRLPNDECPLRSGFPCVWVPTVESERS